MTENRVVLLITPWKDPSPTHWRIITIRCAWPCWHTPDLMSTPQKMRVLPIETIMTRVEEGSTQERVHLLVIQVSGGLEQFARECETASEAFGNVSHEVEGVFGRVHGDITLEWDAVADLAV